ncbi:GDSL-type esterase/lipase family protein [Mucilaginibacter sp. UR6-1]|uniref:GDSL-type esterase/lipase family protein n=1 Tax=Mucilaginibacter sp. UR6-1 TaxID=1435643 RepID=UPI001E2CDF0E|nr:GDSL-type esterase/lipase family protein [Mucilaginibacter sp. UR6-1]MCC8410120.1 GDSL-type esterase/lipase family protein [Mucilaginibacter sp. UR6-1]
MKSKLILTALLLCASSLFAQDKPAAEDFRDDWADLRHYAAENKTLPAPASAEKRVVFLGSSIFEFWKTRMPEYFTNNKNYIDRGISGQISPQLLIRFRQDVIDLKPKAVIILAGSNDLAGSTGHVSIESIMNNVRSMAELAKTHNIKPILCAYLPVFEYPWKKAYPAAENIIALNKAIKLYAEQNKLVLLDYFTPLVDEKNGQRAELTLDGVHPNRKGYEIMARVTDEAIKRALK